jgi:glycerophosphoryl diester phosphodiesterase
VPERPWTGYDLGVANLPRPLHLSIVVMTLLVVALVAAACGTDETARDDDPGLDQPPSSQAPTGASTADEGSPDGPVGENPPSGPGADPARTTEEFAPLPFHVEGHRGARGLKPENTLPAFETALDIGVTTLELDLHLSADDKVVVWHDNTLGADKCRLADDGSGAEFPAEGVAIAASTLAQLGAYRCDLNPDPQRFPDQDNTPTALAEDRYEPLTLAALFAFVADYANSPGKTDEQRARAAAVEFNIETKRDVDDPAGIGDGFDGVTPGRFELEVLAVVEAAGLGDRVVIQSFDHRSLWAIRSVDADIRLAALTSLEPPDLADYAARGADIWSPNFNVMSSQLVDEAHALGLRVIPWTVNRAEDMTDVLERGADGLITDRPDIAAAMQNR